MSSFRFRTNPKRKQFTRFIARLYEKLEDAYWEEHDLRGLNKSKISEELEVNKGLVSRWFHGTSNITLETLSNLAYAMGRDVDISLPSHGAKNNRGQNYFDLETIKDDTPSHEVQATSSSKIVMIDAGQKINV